MTHGSARHAVRLLVCEHLRASLGALTVQQMAALMPGRAIGDALAVLVAEGIIFSDGALYSLSPLTNRGIEA